MIPFNHLGWIFKTFGAKIYPKVVQEELCTFIRPLSKGAKVLDVGGGTGMMNTFIYTCRKDLALTSVDPAKGMLKFSPSYITSHQGTAEKLPFQDNEFELLLMGESLHHFRNVDEALSESVRVLKAKGKLFIYDFNLNTFMGKSIYRVEKILGEPGNFFEPTSLKNKLETYGFTVQIKNYGWRYTLSAVLEI